MVTIYLKRAYILNLFEKKEETTKIPPFRKGHFNSVFFESSKIKDRIQSLEKPLKQGCCQNDENMMMTSKNLHIY